MLDEFVQEIVQSVRPAMETSDTWEQAVCGTIAAFLAHLGSNQQLLRVAFVEVFEAGPSIVERMTGSLAELVGMLAETAPEPQRGPRIAREAITGAVWGIVSSYAPGGRLGRLPSLAEHLSFTVLAPHVGARRALDSIAAQRRPGLA